MECINYFGKEKIIFSWSELKVGRFGYNDSDFWLEGNIDDAEVINYVVNYLSLNENEENQYLWELAGLFAPYSEDEISRLLNLVANSRAADLVAYYKWRWIMVKNLLFKVKDLDYINAILEINEFWLDLKSPRDMPYQFQGIGNDIEPKDFYTNENLTKIFTNHEKWLVKERIKLSANNISKNIENW